ncbi:hypothetical protein V7094_25940 [Priestia megaterium]|uniref:hypothetical protein n=1 Tax=Priestia megaterium TaxID=1404 RepID=UPI002FFEFC2A
MITGLSKPSIKRVRKNYIPPFEDPAWIVVGDTSMIRDVVKNGYEVSYSTVNNSRYMGMSCTLPKSLAGKTVSISVQEVRGYTGAIQLTWYIGGVATNKNVAFSTDNKFNNITIPTNVDSIMLKIQNNSSSSESYYFRGLQLEEGVIATDFEEQFIDGANRLDELVPKKNIFNVKEFDVLKTVGGGTMWAYDVQGKPNTSYILSTNAPLTATNSYANMYVGGTNSSSNGFSNGSPRKVNTNSGGILNLYIRNQTTSSEASDAYDRLIAGDYWIQIEEGFIATDFEPFELISKLKGERTTPKKNLLKGFRGFILNNFTAVSMTSDWKATFTSNVASSNSYFLVDVKPNTNYAFSITKPSDMQIAVYDSTATSSIVSYTTNSSLTFNSGARSQVRLYIRQLTASVTFELSNPQLEEGTVATAFKEYEDANKQANLVNNKNLVPSLKSGKWTINPNHVILDDYSLEFDTSVQAIQTSSVFIDNIKPNTTYTLSMKKNHSQGSIDENFIKESDGSNWIKDNYMLTNEVHTITTQPTTKRIQLNITNGYGTESVGTFKWSDIQFEEASTNTSFEPQKMVNRTLKSKTAPVLSYPFTFQRDSVEVYNGVRYRRNMPRLDSGGIGVEEGVVNPVYSSPTEQHLKVTGASYDQRTYNHSLPKKNIVQTVDTIYTLSFDIKRLNTAVTQKYFSSIVVGGVVNGDSWNVRLQGTAIDKFTIVELEDGWERFTQTFTITANTQYLQSFVKFIADTWDTGIDSLVRNVQIIELPYDLRYAVLSRPKEIVRLPKNIIDSVQGSVEFTYIPAFNQTEYKQTATHRSYLCSSQGSFNIWSWGGGASHAFNAEFNSKDSNNVTVRNNIDVTTYGLDYIKKGVPIKVKFEWDAQKVTLTIDNNTPITKSVVGTFINVSNSDVFLGSNYSSLTEQNNMNGVYKDLVFKDRNGQITFQI